MTHSYAQCTMDETAIEHRWKEFTLNQIFAPFQFTFLNKINYFRSVKIQSNIRSLVFFCAFSLSLNCQMKTCDFFHGCSILILEIMRKDEMTGTTGIAEMTVRTWRTGMTVMTGRTGMIWKFLKSLKNWDWWGLQKLVFGEKKKLNPRSYRAQSIAL
jgi:hypothetical protein